MCNSLGHSERIFDDFLCNTHTRVRNLLCLLCIYLSPHHFVKLSWHSYKEERALRVYTNICCLLMSCNAKCLLLSVIAIEQKELYNKK